MTGAFVASEMAKRGHQWNRTTTAKIENGQRESVTVDELLTLSFILGVPPIWFLADPKSTEQIPLVSGESADPWRVLMWAAGRAPLEEVNGRWLDAEVPLRQATTIAAVVERFRTIAAHNDIVSAATPNHYNEDDAAETEARILRGLVKPMTWLVDNGFVLPVLPNDVLERARGLGIELPTAEG